MEIQIKQYLSEQRDVIDEAILSENDVLIASPTDSGKTRSLIDFVNRHPSLRIAFTAPTQSLIENIKQGYSVCAGYGAEFVKENYNARFVCTTYDSFLKFSKPFDIVVIDEAHTLAGHGNFRTETLAGLLRSQGKKVMLSGTPEIIEHLEGVDILRFSRMTKPKRANIIELNQSAKNYILNLVSNRNKKNLLLVRINNKSTIDEVTEILNAIFPDLKTAKLYSDSDEVLCAGQDEMLVKEIKKGIIPQGLDILFTTSIIDAGINLQVERDVDAYAIAETYMPNPIDIVQLSARVRSNSDYILNLNIVGKFGKYEYMDKLQVDAPTEEQTIKLMSTYYDWYCQFSCESYLGVLNYYNIVADYYQDRQKDHKVEYAGQIKNVRIVKNLNSFPELYLELTERYRGLIQSDWVQHFSGTDNINSKVNSQVRRIFETIRTATDFKIHPDLYLDASFQEKKLSSLINAVDSFNKSDIQDKPNRFKLIVLEMLENRSSVYHMDLTEYRLLSNQDQESVRTIAKLMFKDSKHWCNKSHKLKPIECGDAVELYLNNFTWLIKAVA